MKFLIDFIPIILFFVAYKVYDIYIATLVAIVASIVQTLWNRFQTGQFEKMHVMTLVIISLLGGLTLFFQDERFIKWKPTIVNWAFAIGIWVSYVITKKSAMKLLLGSKIKLPDVVWRKLDVSWGGFFIVSGVLNLFVAYYFNTDIWVNFKLFGMLALTLVFIIAQSLFLSKHLKSTD